MIRFVKDVNGERVTEMNLKKLAAFLGIITTVSISIFGWGYNLSREVAYNTVKTQEMNSHVLEVEKRIDKQLIDLRVELKDLNSQNQLISRQLTEMLHKQDVRISLLEQNLLHLQKENK